MQSSKPTFLLYVRRLGMFTGFAFFIFFVYRASHDVANPRIAAGTERKQVVIVAGQDSKGALTGRSEQIGYASIAKPAANNSVKGADYDKHDKVNNVQTVNKGKTKTDSSTVSAKYDHPSE
ncbi:MAG TPA: hypothetical protein VM124_02350 [Candidatus Limnocylindrales bacterium]|nr:hypothetical protein [Candidatus Limnocylindrales bacterium]